MFSNNNIAGIEKLGGSVGPGEHYLAVGPIGTAYGQSASDRPIAFANWFDAARFANWMTNGQGAGSTENGAYNMALTEGNTKTVAANPSATFRLPTSDEWYKAAYYNGVDGYYTYATQSNSAPGNDASSPGTGNQANYYVDDKFSLTQNPAPADSNQNYLTNVGYFTGSGSFYNTFDQGGNLNEWNGDAAGSTTAFVRGGSWQFGDTSNTDYDTPLANLYSDTIGFRLAGPVAGPAVPEIDPNSLGSVLALVLGSLGLVERRRLKMA
jgi:formylglycine-generating enzyme